MISLVSHQYFVLGQIADPAAVIDRYSNVLTDLSPKERQLIDAVTGLERLNSQPIALPPRQSNAGYQAERGRVLYCAHSVSPYNSNGYSTRTAGVIGGLRQAGADVVVAARPGYPWDIKTDVAPRSASSYGEVIDGISHFFSHGPTWTQAPLDHYLHQAADSYVQVALRNRVERIHAASNHVTALPALIAARRLGIPFSYEVRGLWEITEASTKPGWSGSDRFSFAKSMEALVATESDVVFAITEQVRQELVARGAPNEKIRIFPNAVDTDEFSEMPKHGGTVQRLKLDQDVPVIGYAGSLVDYEGIETLLEAVATLLSAGVGLRTVIVGDGPALPRLEAKSRSLGITDAVTFTGRVPAIEIPDYVSVFDIMPCPRLPLPVTEMVSPLKPLEAMAAAKAVVLSDLAPLRDLSGRDGERARLFKAGDSSDLARVIDDLIQHPEQRQAMGRRARLWTVDKRTWGKVAEAAFAALASVAEPSGTGRRLTDLTIGIIADEFTIAGLEPETSLVMLSPTRWKSQLDASAIDVLFVESAWDGNDGEWRGKVGFYDNDSFADLRELLEHCRENSVPTLFWNKEDPVHFNRFKRTAEHFEHIFTSDDGSIRNYLESKGSFLKTVASLPFYAQPALHNPLPGNRKYSHTVTYAGSYYGDRYKKRSEQLARLLAAAVPAGLTIYDRQHLNPDSPYKFPADLAPHVQGGLTYAEMVNAYKAHPVHINVNSVEQSGTMFSRRVFEVAACGGAVVSGPGRGIEQIFGSVIPIVPDEAKARVLIDYWMDNEKARNDDAWLAMRSVLRAHTAAHRLTYALRTAGLQIDAPVLAQYALQVPELTPETLQRLEEQSVRPAAVLLAGEPYDPQELLASGISLIGNVPSSPVDRTYYEDLLSSRKYLEWNSARTESEHVGVSGQGLVGIDATATVESADLRSIESTDGAPSLTLYRTLKRPADPELPRLRSAGRRILVAGHDLKFARGMIDHLEAEGHLVDIDQWQGHSQHDEAESRIKLAQAEIIFCEWTLGNAVWFSHNKRSDQRLVCRLHLQELSTPYLGRLKMGNVDQFIFVGRHTAQIAQRDFGIPSEKSVVVPNYVAADRLNLSKDPAARWNIGVVGIVPQRKRLDLVLDVVRGLRAVDDRYKLFIKGKRPEDFPWMAERSDELAYYLDQYRRLDEDPLLKGAVVFDTHGDDMAEWYRKIGTVLSVSDFESFHLTLADGAASRALPVSLAWPGADQIYPVHWLTAEVPDMVQRIVQRTATSETWVEAGEEARAFAQAKFRDTTVFEALKRSVLGG